MNTAVADSWQKALDGLPAKGAPWLADRRETALRHLRERGFPTQRDESWRKTNLASVTRSTWLATGVPDEDTLKEARALLDREPDVPGALGRAVFVNGYLAPSLSSLDGLPEGVRFAGLAEAGDTLEARLGRLLDGEGHPFAALNTALWQDGAFLHFARRAGSAEPLHLVFLTVAHEGTAIHPRLLVLAEESSRGSLLVTWAGNVDGPTLHTAGAEVWLAPNARLDLLEVQRLPPEVRHFESLAVHQEGDSRFSSCCVNLGARLVRNDLRVGLDAEGAACRLDGITIVSGRQHVDVQTTIDHATPHGRSEQLYKGILDDHATTVFSGEVLVRQDAQKTDARQANHNLLLSRDAVADSKPQLEIFADDVKCAHGATVGQLDEDAVFYLRSRGLDLDQARAVLVRAFAWEVAGRLEHDGLQEHLRALLESAL